MSTTEYDTATARLIKMAWDLETDPASFDAKYPNEPVSDDGEIVALNDLDARVDATLFHLRTVLNGNLRYDRDYVSPRKYNLVENPY